jgi:hypothetical protein
MLGTNETEITLVFSLVDIHATFIKPLCIYSYTRHKLISIILIRVALLYGNKHNRIPLIHHPIIQKF